MKNKHIHENFRDFLNGAELGGSGNRYEYGANPEETEDETAKSSDPMSVKNMLSYIVDISNTALNVIENNNMSDAELDKHVYIKRKVENARRGVVEAYLKIQDSLKGK